MLGLNSVLAVFVAGVSLQAVAHSEATDPKGRMQEAVTRFFDLPIFVPSLQLTHLRKHASEDEPEKAGDPRETTHQGTNKAAGQYHCRPM